MTDGKDGEDVTVFVPRKLFELLEFMTAENCCSRESLVLEYIRRGISGDPRGPETKRALEDLIWEVKDLRRGVEKIIAPQVLP